MSSSHCYFSHKVKLTTAVSIGARVSTCMECRNDAGNRVERCAVTAFKCLTYLFNLFSYIYFSVPPFDLSMPLSGRFLLYFHYQKLYVSYSNFTIKEMHES